MSADSEVKLKERALPDNYPIYGDYLYVVDGKVYRSDYHGINVGRLKRVLGANEITNCDMAGRGYFDAPEPSHD